jgi:oligopeptide transport system substrate-binding protein
MNVNKMNRRTFLRTAALTAAAAGLAACGSASTPTAAPAATTAATEVPAATEAATTAAATEVPAATEAATAAATEAAATTGAKILTLNSPAFSGDPGVGSDPGCSGGTITVFMNQFMYSSLVYFDQDMKPQPDCAESWSVSADSTVWTFKLRKDLKWTDGTPITAKDFEWTVKRNSSPDISCGNGGLGIIYMLDIIKGVTDYSGGKNTDPNSVGVKAVDDYTLEFTLTQPAGYFIQMVAYPTYAPLPQKAIEQFGKDTQWTRPEHVINNGPFKLTDWVVDQQYTLEANPNWHGYADKKPGVDKIVVKMLKNEATAVAAYETGELDVIDAPAGDLPRIQGDATLKDQLKSHAGLGTQYLIIPVNAKPFDDVRVRQALSMAIDRETLATSILTGTISPAYQFMPPTMLGYEENLNSELHYNPDKARELLKDAGFDGGKGFPSFFINSNQTDVYQTLFEAVQSMFKDVLGIDMQLALMDANARQTWRDTKPYKLHLWREAWGPDFPDSHNSFNFMLQARSLTPKTNKDHPEFQYKNTKFADLVNAAAKESDATKRQDLYKQADRILCYEDPDIIPLYYSLNNYLVKPRVSGYWVNGMGINYHSVAVEG